VTWTNLTVHRSLRQCDTCDLDARWSQPSTDAAPTDLERTIKQRSIRRLLYMLQRPQNWSQAILHGRGGATRRLRDDDVDDDEDDIYIGRLQEASSYPKILTRVFPML